MVKDQSTSNNSYDVKSPNPSKAKLFWERHQGPFDHWLSQREEKKITWQVLYMDLFLPNALYGYCVQ